jgi:methylmalonyl-CoA mutase
LAPRPTSRRARPFAKNFFEAGGIEALVGPYPADFKASGAALACLCSSDKIYERKRRRRRRR